MSKKKYKPIPNLYIEKYVAEGKCMGKHEDKVIFVEGTVPGDIVNVQITKNKKSYAEARVISFEKYADTRVEAFCKHFGTCGGCKWQHLPYHLQIAYKEQQVKDQLQRIGNTEVDEILPIAPCSEQTFYRNKLEFTFSNKQYLSSKDLNSEISNEKNVLGFHAPRLFDKIIDIDTCYLQTAWSNEVRNFIRDKTIAMNYSYYDHRNHVGLMRNIIIRTSSTGEKMLNVVFGENEIDKIKELMHTIDENFPDIDALLYTINTKWNDTIYDQEVMLYKGKNYIDEKLEDKVFRISAKSFFQTNTKQTEVLYNIVKKMAACSGNEVLYDLYCGTGSIGIFLAENVKKIVGVDSVEQAIEDAKLNALHNGLNNTFYYTGDVIKVCNQDLFIQHGQADIVVIDPPRAGCHEKLLHWLLEIKAPKIVYVSCNPATQARDLQILCTQYDCKLSQSVDMFPHTHHVENVVLLTLKS